MDNTDAIIRRLSRLGYACWRLAGALIYVPMLALLVLQLSGSEPPAALMAPEGIITLSLTRVPPGLRW